MFDLLILKYQIFEQEKFVKSFQIPNGGAVLKAHVTVDQYFPASELAPAI